MLRTLYSWRFLLPSKEGACQAKCALLESGTTNPILYVMLETPFRLLLMLGR